MPFPEQMFLVNIPDEHLHFKGYDMEENLFFPSGPKLGLSCSD